MHFHKNIIEIHIRLFIILNIQTNAVYVNEYALCKLLTAKNLIMKRFTLIARYLTLLQHTNRSTFALMLGCAISE